MENKKELVELCGERLTLPGEGMEVGPSLGANKEFLKSINEKNKSEYMKKWGLAELKVDHSNFVLTLKWGENDVLRIDFKTKNEINSTIYISSIGFEMNEEKLVCYFLSNPLNNISRKENEEKKNEFVKVEVTSIDEGFKKAEKSLLLPLNFRHIKSVVFNESVLKTKHLEEFFMFMRSGLYVTYNYYVFATLDDIEDVFGFNNPHQISYQHSILSSPNLIEFQKYGLEQMHFLDFANDFYEKERYFHIPLIKVSEVWNEKKVLEIDGYIAYGKNISVFRNEEYLGMIYLKNQKINFYYTKEATYRIIGYKVTFKEIDGRFTILAKYSDVYIFGDGSKSDLNEKISLEIKKYLDDYISKQEGLYLIKEYNYLNKKALNVLLYDIRIKNIK